MKLRDDIKLIDDVSDVALFAALVVAILTAGARGGGYIPTAWPYFAGVAAALVLLSFILAVRESYLLAKR